MAYTVTPHMVKTERNDEEMVDSLNGVSKIRRTKFAVPIQPRNANGTFAPCGRELEEEMDIAVSSKFPEKRKTSKERQRQERDVIRITNSNSQLKPKDIFKIGNGRQAMTPEEPAAHVAVK